jgi:hypothetical protein
MDATDVILLLISSDFLYSDCWYQVMLPHTLALHEKGAARLMLVFVRPVVLRGTPLDPLAFLPSKGRSVTLWPYQDEVFREMVFAIRGVVIDLYRQLVLNIGMGHFSAR